MVGRDALSREMTASLLADMPIVVQTAASIVDVEKRCRMGCFDAVPKVFCHLPTILGAGCYGVVGVWCYAVSNLPGECATTAT